MGGTPERRGRDAVLEFYRGTIGPVTVRVIDVMTFNDAGRFTSMKAYFAPNDITQSDH